MQKPTRTEGVLALALFVLVFAFACGDPHGGSTELRFEDAVLVASIDPATPRVGTNALQLELRRADGTPIEAAAIEASVRMPAMGAMSAMGGPVVLSPIGPGRHRGEFELAMGGAWQVALEVRIADRAPLRAEGSLTVGTAGLRLTALAARPPTSPVARTGEPGEHGAHSDDAEHVGEIVLSPDRLQRIGVSTTKVERRSLATRVHASGRVVAPESGLVDVALKIGGFASALRADAVGVRVERGAPLFDLYSPELLIAQQEYLEALRSQEKAHDTSAPDRADPLVEASRARLRRWDVDPREIERLTRTRVVRERVPIPSPTSGFVVEKNLVEGAAVEAGERLYRIASLDTVWIEAEVYESELAGIAVGARATVTLPALPGRSLEAHVAYLQPALDAATRTIRVRLELANPELALRPNMNAEVELEGTGREALVVPQSALLSAGRRDFVFRALGEGRFRPEPVEVGRRVGEEVEILSGLAEGDAIVRSGTFLVAAESRLRAALETW
jgi:Cu(I)/Ag(I) efflux system membrane fusion protein